MLRSSRPETTVLDMDYLERLGLRVRPFGLTPDPAFHFESKSHSEAMAGLISFLSRKEQLALVFGDVGTGKTILSRRFLASLDRERYDTGLIINPMMNETDFLSEAIKGLGANGGFLGQDPARRLQQHLLDRLEKGRQTVLAIDEAQLLSGQTFRFLGTLASHESGAYDSLQIILFGQEEVVTRLMGAGMKSVRRAVTLTRRLRPLSGDEVAPYVAYRLAVAGSKGNITFTADAIRTLFTCSEGYPRIINTLCDQCLLLLASHSGSLVDQRVMKLAFKRISR
jgi:type II secretory pathway predicted ATPase ExeA